MKIVTVKHEDIPKVLPLVKAFHEETLKPFGMGYDVPSVENTIRMFVENHIGLAVLNDTGDIVGVIGGAIAPSFTNYKTRIFLESMWYVLPEYRGKKSGVELLKMVEKYCHSLGIDKIVMIGMCNDGADRLSGFYESMGYKKLEIHYQKDLYDAETKS